MLINSLFSTRVSPSQIQTSRYYGVSTPSTLPMKAGTVLKFLDFVKDQEAPVVLPRDEYPSWVGELVRPQQSLAVLRRIPNEEAEDSEIRRYLKLTRRQRIQDKNEQASV